MRNRVLVDVLLLAGVATVTAPAPWDRSSRSPDQPTAFTVHEWGTFTTVAGEDGRAIEWLPLGGPADLPCFVEHYQNNQLVKYAPGSAQQPLDYAGARAALRAKVRMETPVLYFYAPRDTEVNVRVWFPRGVLTEWYPHARVTQPPVSAATLRDPGTTGVIGWQNVRITPSVHEPPFAVDHNPSHYYAARHTDAAPLAVNAQAERFLFYRGIADFDVPLSAELLADGRIRLRDLRTDEIPAAVVFERRGAKVGFRVERPVRDDVTIDAPALDGNLARLDAALERLLVAQGLYPKEAKAMIETWRDSWFEEGTRVFYIVPPRAVNAILPLEVRPAPARTARVFVGRMDVVTPADERAVEQAVAHGDSATLERYGRFLGPITDRLLARTADGDMTARLRAATNAAFAALVRHASSVCE